VTAWFTRDLRIFANPQRILLTQAGDGRSAGDVWR
jgi:hypothetical protein